MRVNDQIAISIRTPIFLNTTWNIWRTEIGNDEWTCIAKNLPSDSLFHDANVLPGVDYTYDARLVEDTPDA